jgi:galactonate dehydratase
MKITDIRTADVLGFGYATYVRVLTDEGLTGTGECVHAGAGCATLIQAMKGAVIGQDPLDVDRHFETLRRRHFFDGTDAGSIVAALSGIEIALWDLAGKALGTPVYRLLGGKFRSNIRTYSDFHAGNDGTPESYAARAKEAVAKGFTALKFDLDVPSHPEKHDPYNHTVSPAELHAMVDRVAAVREAIGPKVDLALDLHGQCDMHSGIRIARAVEPFDLLWLEEPVPPGNVDALREVKRSSGTPICVGENLYTRWGFREVLEKQAADIIMPDIPKCGGISECRKIANMAETYYVPLAPHNVSGPIGTLASCHVCASIPNFLVLEWHWTDIPYWSDLAAGGAPIIENGAIQLPETPGLGVELNEEEARKHLRPGTRLFES